MKFAQCVLYKLHFNTLTFAMASIYSSTEDITNTKDIRESILRSGLRADPLNGLELHRNAREWRHFLPHLVKKPWEIARYLAPDLRIDIISISNRLQPLLLANKSAQRLSIPNPGVSLNKCERSLPPSPATPMDSDAWRAGHGGDSELQLN